MLQESFYDPYDDEELVKKMSDYERKKKQYANLYCRRQRMEDSICKHMGTKNAGTATGTQCALAAARQIMQNPTYAHSGLQSFDERVGFVVGSSYTCRCLRMHAWL